MNNEIKKFYKDHSTNKGTSLLSEDAKLRVKNEIFSNLGAQLTPEPVSFVSKFLIRGYVIAPLIVILFVTGTTIVSADALPGDKLYSVKRHVENARLFVAPNEDAKLDLQVNFAQERLDEAERVGGVVVKDKVRIEDAATIKRENNREQNKPDDLNKVEDSKDDDDDENNRSEHRERSRKEADKALEFLDEAKKDLREKGKEERAHEIEDRVKRFRGESDD